jgi:hypothetical protein
MKKSYLIASIAVLGLGTLAGCTLANTTDAAAPTSLQKEIASASLLMKSTSSTSNVSFAKRSTSTSPEEASPIAFSGSSISESLASFDALAVDSYTAKSETLTSDRTEYASEEKLTFTLPSGTSQEVYLYYGDPQTVATSIGASVAASVTVETSTTTSEGTTSATSEETTFAHYAHGFGYRGGFFAGMLSDSWSFMDDDTSTNVTRVSTWKAGLAVIEDVSYHFFSEDLTITKDTKSYSLSSFTLIGERGNFLSVEQAEVENAGKTATVYAYTSFNQGSYVRMLLQNSETTQRLVYKTPFTKLAIDRYLDEGKTLYAVHFKVAGSMSLVGVYEKVVTSDSEGNSVVTYVLQNNVTSVPSEQ